MKKLGIVIILIASLFSCSGDKRGKSKEPITIEMNNLVTYKYKLAGLQDTVIFKSINKIIFQVDGVEKMIVSQNDSLAVFTVDPELVSNALLREEIEKRGGKLLN
ncbi:hypothetical protein ES705_14201 [subsurface metagenome]